MDLFDIEKNMRIGLFLWSVLCFLLGVAFSGALYHYHINGLINRANKLLEQLRKPDLPLPPEE